VDEIGILDGVFRVATMWAMGSESNELGASDSRFTVSEFVPFSSSSLAKPGVKNQGVEQHPVP
jgi:hypothetical protein